MASFSLIRPVDQPLGTRRLLHEIKDALSDRRLSSLRLIVAYAKSGPLHRLREHFDSWRSRGGTTEAILGIDQQGTSREALELALTLFDSVYITQANGITFHPKIYLFTGETFARAFVGSNNLTVGGTETNFEAAIGVELALPADARDLEALESAWNDLLPDSCSATRRLTAPLLQELRHRGAVLPERRMRARAGVDATLGLGIHDSPSQSFGLPASPLPKAVLPTNPIPSAAETALPTTAVPVRGLAIQIKPHHNGEIFLSRTALRQNPGFFGWPFTGKTNPKKAGNPSYPRHDPDPVVDIVVIGRDPTPLLQLSSYPLTTVYYATKSEIRITALPLVAVVPEYSVMLMERSDSPQTTYQITIHTPDSPEYPGWVAACNQKMPGGGREPRRFGWF